MQNSGLFLGAFLGQILFPLKLHASLFFTSRQLAEAGRWLCEHTRIALLAWHVLPLSLSLPLLLPSSSAFLLYYELLVSFYVKITCEVNPVFHFSPSIAICLKQSFSTQPPAPEEQQSQAKLCFLWVLPLALTAQLVTLSSPAVLFEGALVRG